MAARLVAILTAVQTWRVGGIIFVKGAYEGWLPPSFGFVAGWGDFLVGVTAPLVAYGLLRGIGLGPWVTAMVWNALGITDLAVAVSVGFLSQAAAMLVFLLVLVPTVFVPALIVAYIVTLLLLTRKNSKEHFLRTVMG